MKINLVLLDDTVNGYFTWRNLQLNHLWHVLTLKDTNSFIQMSWMNLFVTLCYHSMQKQFFAIQRDAVRKELDKGLVVYLMFICLVV